MPTTKQIARAWKRIPHEYGCRRNKAREDGKQWEVYAFRTSGVINDSNPKVLAAFADDEAADAYMIAVEDDARAKAVLRLFAPS